MQNGDGIGFSNMGVHGRITRLSCQFAFSQFTPRVGMDGLRGIWSL
jgi:hypothetical protein